MGVSNKNSLGRKHSFQDEKQGNLFFSIADIRSRGNKNTELALAGLFRAEGITGWRRQVIIQGRDAALRRPRRLPGRNRSTRVATLDASQTSQRDVPTFRVRPDFVFPKLRLAVFVDGCFRHGCPKHATQPKGNAAFWRRKFAVNKARDRKVNRELKRAGWRVLRLWEHELARKNGNRLLRRLRLALAAAEDSTARNGRPRR